MVVPLAGKPPVCYWSERPQRGRTLHPGVALTEACPPDILQALLADDAAFTMWQTRHKGQLRGSSRVLTALVAAYPGPCMPLLSVIIFLHLSDL